MKFYLFIIFVFCTFSCSKKPPVVPVNTTIEIEEGNKLESSDQAIVKIENEVEIPIQSNSNISEPITSIEKEYEYDQLFPDSIWTEYMTKRGDYLSLIAYKEYNNANEWRRIYQWNRDK